MDELLEYGEELKKDYGIDKGVKINEKELYELLEYEGKSFGVEVIGKKISKEDLEKYVLKYEGGYDVGDVSKVGGHYYMKWWGKGRVNVQDYKGYEKVAKEAVIKDTIHTLNKLNKVLGVGVRYEGYKEQGNTIEVLTSKGKGLIIGVGVTDEGKLKSLLLGIKAKGKKYSRLLDEIKSQLNYGQ